VITVLAFLLGPKFQITCSSLMVGEQDEEGAAKRALPAERSDVGIRLVGLPPDTDDGNRNGK
jgi:hypothetical protein